MPHADEWPGSNNGTLRESAGVNVWLWERRKETGHGQGGVRKCGCAMQKARLEIWPSLCATRRGGVKATPRAVTLLARWVRLAPWSLSSSYSRDMRLLFCCNLVDGGGNGLDVAQAAVGLCTRATDAARELAAVGVLGGTLYDLPRLGSTGPSVACETTGVCERQSSCIVLTSRNHLHLATRQTTSESKILLPSASLCQTSYLAFPTPLNILLPSVTAATACSGCGSASSRAVSVLLRPGTAGLRTVPSGAFACN